MLVIDTKFLHDKVSAKPLLLDLIYQASIEILFWAISSKTFQKSLFAKPYRKKSEDYCMQWYYWCR